jgi:hypothetical protein
LKVDKKPGTHYFAGGYVTFYTIKKELHYEIHEVTKEWSGMIRAGSVSDEQHLKDILAIKSVEQAVALKSL